MDCNLSASGANLANFFFLCAALLPSSFCYFSRFRAYTAHFANFPILCGLIMQLILIMNQLFFVHLCGQAKANELINYADCPKPLFSGQILLGIAEIMNYLIDFP